MNNVPEDFDVIDCGVHKLERELAVEYARFTIETRALLVQVKEGPVSIYDLSKLEPTTHRDGEMLEADREAITRSAMYLGLIGLLVRIDPKRPELVSIRNA